MSSPCRREHVVVPLVNRCSKRSQTWQKGRVLRVSVYTVEAAPYGSLGDGPNAIRTVPPYRALTVYAQDVRFSLDWSRPAVESRRTAQVSTGGRGSGFRACARACLRSLRMTLPISLIPRPVRPDTVGKVHLKLRRSCFSRHCEVALGDILPGLWSDGATLDSTHRTIDAKADVRGPSGGPATTRPCGVPCLTRPPRRPLFASAAL